MSLWRFDAVKYNSMDPFKLASGNHSPIYINCRQVISQTSFMDLFVTSSKIILTNEGVNVEMVAGGETAGIPYGAYLAQGLNSPMVYIRKAKKGYGLANLIEGGSVKGKNVVLIEDLITDGGSKLHFVEVLRAAGAIIKHALVLFDRNQGGAKILSEHGVTLHSVVDLELTLKVAEMSQIYPQEDILNIQDYLHDPAGWHKSKGLDFKL